MHQAERREAELEMVSKLVDTVLAAGYVISVHDGEEYAIRYSNSREKILGELFATDEESLIISRPRDENGVRLYMGSVLLVYGNEPWEVIADNSDVPLINELLKPAEELAKQYEERKQ